MAPDQSELYVTNNSTAELFIIDLATGGVSSVPIPAGASTIAMSADGTRLYVGMLFAGAVEILDRATRSHIRTVMMGGVVRDMATDARRNQIIVTNQNGWVDIMR
jgi:DNA-binding beta-propeller fold protein YncE